MVDSTDMSQTAQVTREYADTQTQVYPVVDSLDMSRTAQVTSEYADTKTQEYRIARGGQSGHVPDCPGN